jgi:predicted aspartyl protease
MTTQARAVLDEGFTGFLLIPLKIFKALKLDELKLKHMRVELA